MSAPTPGSPLQVTGHGGTIVTFDGASVTISRSGFLARATIGKGTKSIPLAQIAAVQFKPAGWLVNGFIQFTHAGGNEVRSQFGHQTATAARDENSIVFTTRQQPVFEELRAAIEKAMAAPASGVAAVDPVDQLQRLVDLRASGAVSAQEFDALKARLLGS